MSSVALWLEVGRWTHCVGAVACVVSALWIAGRKDKRRESRSAISALTFTAIWCLVAALATPLSPWTLLAEVARNLGWFLLLYRLFDGDGRSESLRPIRPLIAVLVLVEALQPGFLLAQLQFASLRPAQLLVFHLSAILHLIVLVGALLLVHNLYVGASVAHRRLLRWPAVALAVMWVYDLNFYTVGYLGEALSAELAGMRGLVAMLISLPLAIGASRASTYLDFKPSREVAFQTLSLLAIGGYLLLMVAIAQAIPLIGGGLTRLTQVSFVFVASVAALLWFPSQRLRGWLKVVAVKHFFQHRYDYRAEWLRFTRTIGRAGPNAPPLHERVVKAVADIADSPSGLLLLSGESEGSVLAARWQWPSIEVPAQPMNPETVAFFEAQGLICDLDEIRAGKDTRGMKPIVPQWMLDDPNSWAIVPLLHYDRLVGLVVLARPAVARKLDWEDFDLLRVVGQQLASYLAEHSGQEALGEASRFDEFNRRIAFVMHDIKNLASQLSLLARNAEKHADKPEFRVDMLVTLRNSADKLNTLLARLNRYGPATTDKLTPMPLDSCVAEIVGRYEGIHPVILVQNEPCMVNADLDSLDQALVHLIQNAIDASASGSPVFVRVGSDHLHGIVEVIDSGCGMTPEFIRTRLFKPFVSSKQGGFGIGAFEARALIGAMRGRLDVESREGLGTRFFVRLPRVDVADFIDKIEPNRAEVA